MILAVTGHRPPKVGGYTIPNRVYEAVMQGLDESLMRLSPDSVIVGMALGVDQWAAELCIMNDIPFTAAIPFDGYDQKWPPAARTRYRSILTHASRTVVITPGAAYDPSLLQIRNSWMVSNSDAVLAVWNGMPGGTANCIRAARHYHKEIHRVEISQEIWDVAHAIEQEMTVGIGPRITNSVNMQITFSDSQGNILRIPEAAAARAEELIQIQRRQEEEEQQRHIHMEEVRRREETVDRQRRLRELNRAGRSGRNRRLMEAGEEYLDGMADLTDGHPLLPVIQEDIARMRELLDQRILEEARRIPESVNPEKVLRDEVVRIRRANAPEKVSEDMKPKRVIEIGED